MVLLGRVQYCDVIVEDIMSMYYTYFIELWIYVD
jgi:hypothetical protein